MFFFFHAYAFSILLQMTQHLTIHPASFPLYAPHLPFNNNNNTPLHNNTNNHNNNTNNSRQEVTIEIGQEVIEIQEIVIEIVIGIEIQEIVVVEIEIQEIMTEIQEIVIEIRIENETETGRQGGVRGIDRTSTYTQSITYTNYSL